MTSTTTDVVLRAFWRASPHEVIREIDPNSSPPMAAIAGRTLKEVPEGEPWIGLDGRFHAVDVRAPLEIPRYWLKLGLVVHPWIEVTEASWLDYATSRNMTPNGMGFTGRDVVGIKTENSAVPSLEDYVNLDGVLIYRD